MRSLQNVPIPEVYILWHPDCYLGHKLAPKILEWLRPGNNGLGPSVFYRSLPAHGSPENGLPLPLPEVASARTTSREAVTNLQIVLVLIDDNMVADFTWRRWLDQLANPTLSKSRTILPIALDATAYNMPAYIKQLNYLRPSGLPLTPPPTSLKFEVPDQVVQSLRKQLTEALCRLMLPREPQAEIPPGAARGGPADAPPQVTVFLSHAKADGTLPARGLRDYIYSQTQLSAFYDENDIAYGAGFAHAIEKSINSGETAALIAVRSNLYASRPWCRREISLFRTPQRVGSDDQTERWRLQPILVVEAMDGGERSAGIPEFGNSPMIRWNKGQEELIVTIVMRDAMLASFHHALGSAIKKPGIVINWLPDPTTLLQIPAIKRGDDCDLYYPGRGLTLQELKVLDVFFPNVNFVAFEEALS